MWTPVAFPPGRFRLATNPALIGSPLPKTIGMVVVAAFAARAEGSPPAATSTATWRLTSSAARAGNRSYSPRAQRNSMTTFLPSVRPPSPKPLWKAATTVMESSGPRLLMNPITGIAGCCAYAPSGHAAAPPSRVINWRRFTPVPPVLPAERIAHPNYGRRLLRCGISNRPTSAQGQTRSFGVVGSMSGLRESGHVYGGPPGVEAHTQHDFTDFRPAILFNEGCLHFGLYLYDPDGMR